MTEQLLLRNAPLVEVIAELHWKLTPDERGEGGHDPLWFALANKFSEWARTDGYGHIEQLVPAGITVPLDMLGRSPILRFRPEPNTWPLVQLGQGLLTVNAVPPYDGWSNAVAPRLEKALASLVDLRGAGPNLAVEKIELRYLDAFTEKHGVSDAMGYMDRELGLIPTCPQPWSRLKATGSDESFSGEFRFSVASPSNSIAVVKYKQGKLSVRGDEKKSAAAVFDFVVASNPNAELTVGEILAWFDKAHEVSKSLFSGALSDRVKKEVG